MTDFNLVALPASTKAEAILALRRMLAGNPPAMINQECLRVAEKQSTNVTGGVYRFSDGSQLDARGWIKAR